MHFKLYASVIAVMITGAANACESTTPAKILFHASAPSTVVPKGGKVSLQHYSIYGICTKAFICIVQYRRENGTFEGYCNSDSLLYTFRKKTAAGEYLLLKKFYDMERDAKDAKIIRQAASEPDYNSFKTFVLSKTK